MSENSEGDDSKGTKPCPSCGGEIKSIATRCRHCREEVPSSETKPCIACAEDIPEAALRCKYCATDQPGSGPPEAAGGVRKHRKSLLFGAAATAVAVIAAVAFLLLRSDVPPAVEEARDKLDCAEYQEEYEEEDAGVVSLLGSCTLRRLGGNFAAQLDGSTPEYESLDVEDGIGCAFQLGDPEEEEELAVCLLEAGL